jgi:hypothetical protein
LYKVSVDGESSYTTPEDDTETVDLLTYIEVAPGVRTPAFINADPDGKSGFKAAAIDVAYTIMDDSETIYTGQNKSDDVFVEITTRLDGETYVPVLYKTAVFSGTRDKYNAGLDEVDEEEFFQYAGDIEYEGVTYNKWDKYELEDTVQDYVRAGYSIYTNLIVVDGEATITTKDI